MKTYISYPNGIGGGFVEQSLPQDSGGLPYLRFLTTAGDSTGVNNLIGNYSAAPTDFYYSPPTNTKYHISSVLIQISDNATFNQIDYGGMAALTNGIKFYIQEGTTPTVPLLSGVIVKQNNDWLGLTGDVLLTTFSGTAQTLGVSFNLFKDFGEDLELLSTSKFIVRLNDDFTSLVAHRFILRGRLETL